MQVAIEEAKKCEIDIPVGCVIKKNGKIIAKAHNMVEQNSDTTAHAEILAIREAQNKLKTTKLRNCELYVTLEPCPMCAWAILQAGLRRIYFGSYNLQYGAMGSVLDLKKIAKSKLEIYGGIEENTCNRLLEKFFVRLRNDNKN